MRLVFYAFSAQLAHKVYAKNLSRPDTSSKNREHLNLMELCHANQTAVNTGITILNLSLIVNNFHLLIG